MYADTLQKFAESGDAKARDMTIFTVALMAPHPDAVTLGGAGWDLLGVTIDNASAGAGFMGAAYRAASKPMQAATILISQPAE